MLSVLMVVSSWVAASGNSQVGLSFQSEGAPDEFMVTEGVSTPFKVYSQLYYSQGFPLLPGQMLFTSPSHTPIPKPSGAFAIVGMVGDIAKDGPGDQKVAAPLSEVYDHHWIVQDLYHRNELCPYGPNYIFGIGAESRNTPLTFPKGKGYHVAADDQWGGNIHLLRTDGGSNLAGDNPHLAEKECAECYYSPAGTKGPECTPERNGTFQCCGENCYDGTCSCPTKAGTPMVPVTYYLRFRLNYTFDVSAIAPVKVGVLTTPNCATFYEVYRNDESPETLSSTTFQVGNDGEMLFSVGHMHTGGINVSVYHNDHLMCASYPTYGKREGVAGDELGHLVGISPCYNADDHDGKGFAIKQGDRVRLDAYYWVGSKDPRIAPSPGGTHLNVMAYLYTAYTGITGGASAAQIQAPTLGCSNLVRQFCSAVIGFPDECASCALRHRTQLKVGGCNGQDAENTCVHMQSIFRNTTLSKRGLPRRPSPQEDVHI